MFHLVIPETLGLEVRLQFELDLEHKLDYCKVFDKDPTDSSVTPTVDDYLLRSVFMITQPNNR